MARGDDRQVRSTRDRSGKLEPAQPAAPETSDADPVPGLDAIGQGGLAVTPLQLARAFAALRSNGRLPSLSIVGGLEEPGEAWVDIPLEESALQTASTAASAAVMHALDRVPGGFRAMPASALTGSGGRRVNWFAGASAEGEPGLVVVVVVENGTLADAWRIGKQALSSAGTAVR